MPLMEVIHRVAKILKRHDIDVRQRRFDDLIRNRSIRFVAIAKDQMVFVVTADRIMSGSIVAFGKLR